MKKIGLIAFLALSAAQTQAVEFSVITSGGPGGTYNRIAGDICKEINNNPNKDTAADTEKCMTFASKGSVHNMQSVSNGKAKFGIVQSDVLAQQGSQYPNVKALMGLYTETVIIASRADKNIGQLSDLKGKTVNLGQQGSGVWATSNLILQAADIAITDFKSVVNISPYGEEARSGLCGDQFDAMVYIGGTPAKALHNLVAECDVKLIGLPQPLIDKMTTDANYFFRSTIPANTYHGVETIKSLGVNAILIADTDAVDEAHGYKMVKNIIDQQNNIKNNVQAFGASDTSVFISPNQIAPLHTGALRYFKEYNYIK